MRVGFCFVWEDQTVPADSHADKSTVEAVMVDTRLRGSSEYSLECILGIIPARKRVYPLIGAHESEDSREWLQR